MTEVTDDGIWGARREMASVVFAVGNAQRRRRWKKEKNIQ